MPVSRRAHTARTGAALLLAIAAGAGEPLGAQQLLDPQTASEDAEVRREARRAQRGFESRRRTLLPFSSGGGGRCDVRIGRYCYWYDEGLSAGPTEPARIARERRRLLATLDAAAADAPRDGWVAGQRVRYWLESGVADTALLAARRCAAEPWWCSALRGMAHHAAGDYVDAEQAFDAALAGMPAARACAWNDIEMLLAGDARRRYRSLSCEQRAAIERRFWWLSDPLLSVPGNDRRTEHYVRHVLSRLHTDARSPYSTSWGDDLHELLLRYGWPERWSRRAPGGVGSVGSITPDVVGHEPVPSYRFAPDGLLLDSVQAATREHWSVRDRDATERYTPAYARQLRDLPASLLAFRRGDSLLLAGTYRLAGDSVLAALARGPAHVALAAAREARDPRVATRTRHADHEVGALSMLVPEAPLHAAIEVRDDAGRAARWRAAVHPPELEDGLGISALLLFQPTGDADTTLVAALAAPVVLGRTPSAPRLGLYWELYGLPAGVHALDATLVVEAARAGRLRRAWRRLRGAAAPAPVHLQWRDVVAVRQPWTPRAMHVAVPELAPGRYQVELRVRVPGGRTLTARESLEIGAR